MAKKSKSKTRNAYVPPVSKEEFLASGEIVAVIGGTPLTLKPRQFASGSYGYGVAGGEKLHLLVAGKVVKLQPGINLVVCGSKPGELTATAEAPAA